MKKIQNVLSVILAVVMVFCGVFIAPDTNRYKAMASGVSVSYMTHVQSYGDQSWVSDGQSSGTSGESKRLESIKIKLADGVDGGIAYTTHVQSYGWLGEVSNGAVSGTSGESKRLEAIKIRLTGNIANSYDVYYRVHAQTYGWQAWVKNGELAGTSGMSKRLEAIQIKVLPKGASPISSGSTVTYTTHVQTFGWLVPSADGNISGTSGLSKRLEAIKINVDSSEYSGGIKYMTHIQSYGWETNWSSNGSQSGTNGQSKRLEAVKIRLTGEIANYYDVYYQVHVQSRGWMDWAKNGAEAGTSNGSKRLEAIKIVLVPKGGNAPSNSNVSNVNKGVSFYKYIKSTSSNDAYINQVIDIVNKNRTANGLGTLKKNETLTAAANQRAKEIAILFSHKRPNKTSCFTVYADYGIVYMAAGENIAAGYTTPNSVMVGWMNSPGHRANILEERFGEIGVGYYYDPNGEYQHYWVQLFKD